MNVGVFVNDDQRALELAHILGIDAEIRLQRHFNMDARRDIDEAAARPDGRVQRGEFIVI